jgi:DNA polymerase-3 subunit alpha
MPASFVHLHNRKKYSMLDGAQKLRPMFAEAARQGMPAVAMSDHGNMFGAHEYARVARETGSVKPVIGIEAYAAPSSRFSRRQEFWGTGSRRGDDVSCGGRYTHMTMWATTGATSSGSARPPATRGSSRPESRAWTGS